MKSYYYGIRIKIKCPTLTTNILTLILPMLIITLFLVKKEIFKGHNKKFSS